MTQLPSYEELLKNNTLDPVDIGEQKKLIQQRQRELNQLQEVWGIYVPLIVGGLTMLQFFVARSKNKTVKTFYQEYYPLINGITIMVPAYFSWQTIKFRRVNREIAELENSIFEKSIHTKEMTAMSGIGDNYEW